jgi:hypothetical protein
MGGPFLDQGIGFKFCVKLGKNTSSTCSMLFEACGAESMRKSSVFEWHALLKKSSHVEITNEENAHHFLR